MNSLQKLSRFLFVFGISWLLLSIFGLGQKPPEYTEDIVLTAKEKYSLGSPVTVTVYNNMEKTISIDNDCQKTPLKIEQYKNGEWLLLSAPRKSQNNCSNIVNITAKSKKIFSYANETFDLFAQPGKYRVSVEYKDKNFSHEFMIKDIGFFKNFWYLLVYKPIYNLIIFCISFLPGHSLGFAIILTTVIIRLILLLPNHKAMQSQKALQKIQPELQKIKEKYKGDQAKIAQETMQIWKKYKINPAGSCLPILLQFPILIALFYILKTGFSSSSAFFLYDIFKNFNFTNINNHFFILNLTNPGTWYLALMVGGLQFFQMKLSFANTIKNSSKKGSKQDFTNVLETQMKIMNSMFKYVMPVMISFFVISLPAGVGLYWGTSTIFSVAQQQYVNNLGKNKKNSK